MKPGAKSYHLVSSRQQSYLLAQLFLLLLRPNCGGALGKPATTVQCFLHRSNNNGSVNDFRFVCRNEFRGCVLYVEWPQTDYASHAIEDLPSFDLLTTNCSAPGISKDKIATLDMSGNRIAVIQKNYFCTFRNLLELVLISNELSESDGFGIGPDCESNTTALDLRHNAFLELTNFSFSGSPNLVQLDLSMNLISKIGEFAFSKLDRLHRLKLGKNNLRGIAAGAFRPLISLNELDLSRNKLNEASTINFEPLVSLKILNLEGNKYRSINATHLMGLAKLETLLLGGNSIATLHDAFHRLTSLVFLDLKLNHITTTANASLCNLHNLAKLYLSTNKIAAVPKGTFCPNNSLVTLDLRSNKLYLFPDISHLEKLQFLLLAANMIPELSSDDLKVICHLRSLEHVDLSRNEIASIQPGMFDCLQNLTVLMLNNNNLMNVSSLFGATDKQIKSLTLHYNRIAELQFDEIPASVITLNVSHNDLRQFPKFRGDSRRNLLLNTLDLSINPISGTVDIVELPVHLEHLNLSSNNINYFTIFTDPERAEGEAALKSINLRLNSIYLACQPLLVLVSKQIPTVQLTENRLVCSCEVNYIHLHITPLRAAHGTWKRNEIGEAQLLGPNSTALDVTQVPNPEDFLCQSLNTGRIMYQCNTHSTYNTKCHLPCPEVCTCYVHSTYDRQLINCSSRGLFQVPTMRPSYLQITLNLSHNRLGSLDPTMLTSYPRLHALHLDHNDLKSIDSGALQAVPQLAHLNLKNNLLSSILSGTFENLPNLVSLDLAFNLLTYIPEDTFQSLHSIRNIELHNNFLSNFSVWRLGELDSINALQVTLRDNPWSCECDYIEQFRSWLQNYSKAVLDVSQLFCTFSDGIMATTPLISFNASYCYETSSQPLLMGNIPVLASLLAIFLFLTISAVLLFIYRREMQVLVYSRYGIRLSNNEEDEPDKKYDGFIAYSSLDGDFVAEKLLPGLEEIENPYKMCLHERDFLVGGYISENILDAVATSRRTIILLSESFVSSNWCRYEFLMAHHQMLNDKANRVIIIVVGKIPDQLDPEIKLYMKTNTYLQWGDRLFWKKLYYALPNRLPQTVKNE